MGKKTNKQQQPGNNFTHSLKYSCYFFSEVNILQIIQG